MKAVAIFLSILVFVACLVIGIQAGNMSSASSGSQPTATIFSTSPTPQLQRTLLLISVDDLLSDTPRLNSLWLAFYRLNLPRVTILPLYPANPGAELPGIASAFQLTSSQEPDDRFIDTLHSYNINWDGYLLIDQSGTASLIDWLQGVQIEGIQLDGPSAVNSLIPPWEDEQAALLAQKRLGMGICSQLSTLPANMDWLNLTSQLIPQHLHTNLGLEMFIADWKALVGDPTPLTCEIPLP